MKRILTTATALCLAVFAFAQGGFWQDATHQSPLTNHQSPITFRPLSLDLAAVAEYLRQAPLEFTEAARNQPLMLELPMPDGSFDRFAVVESPVMEAGLAAAFPEIKTFSARSLTDPFTTARLGFSPQGFDAIVRGSQGGTWLVKPAPAGSFYLSYFEKDAPHDTGGCGLDHAEMENQLLDKAHLGASHLIPPTSYLIPPPRTVSALRDLHTYRLAIATTAEYSTNHGGTVASVLAAVTTLINQTNSLYERENAIRLLLIDSTINTFFFPPNNMDPYTNGNAAEMLGENPAVLNAAYGPSGFDIGHVLGVTNAGGVIGIASLGSVCSGNKARGASNKFQGDIYITFIHEVGHQFNATHTFNNCDGQNENAPTGYEPGSGSTIMSYAGACGTNNVQSNSDDYFHVNSLERIYDFSRDGNSGGVCNQLMPVGNNTPEVSIPIVGGFFIPIGTPFELTGVASDADGDDLQFNWEQYDIGPASELGTPIGAAPLFRSFPPGASPTRVFPKMQTIVFNQNDKTEVLPSITRPLTFRFIARDNHPNAGGWSFAEIAFNATAAAGPFRVTQPNNSGLSLEVGKYVEVKWDVANSDAAPVNCQSVNVRLSTDGGFTYPITLLAGTPNDGSAFVCMPDFVTTTARIRVEAADNIFFDISNFNFAIVPPSAPGFAFKISPEQGQVCLPESFTVNLETVSLLGFAEAVNFEVVSGLPANAVANFTSNPVTPGDPAVLTIDFSNVSASGNFDVVVRAQADTSAIVHDRLLTLTIVSNDFNALQILTPTNGSAAETTLPVFTWTDLPNALTYDIEIATSPTFGASVVESASNLTDASFTPAGTLTENEAYFWRIRPANECGDGEWMEAAAFHTVALSCATFQRDTTYQIAATGLPFVQSKINVSQAGVISDVNVTYVKGTHDTYGDLAFRLKSPNGTKVTLDSAAVCFVNAAFNLGFDDQISTNPPCPPPTNGSDFQADGDLSKFNGQNAQGQWTLEFEVVNTLGNGGSFTGWGLEICGAIGANNPFVKTNAELCVPPGGNRLVYLNTLEIEDADNNDSQLQFTVVTKPAHGNLTKNGTPLNVGGQFTMEDIVGGKIRYVNTNASATSDYFTFVVEDGNGGFLGTPKYDIAIQQGCPPDVSGTEDELEAAGIRVYPNPAGELATLEFAKPVAGEVEILLLNLQGQRLLSQRFEGGFQKTSLATGGLPAGAYLLQVKTEAGVFVKKLVVE